MDWGSVKAILCDISGVLYNPDGLGGGAAIDGSVEAVVRLKAANFPLKFVTNESQTTRANLAAKLAKLGFPVTDGDIVSPVTMVAAVLRERNWKAHMLVHRDCMPDLLDVATTDSSQPADCVVVGDAAEGFSYAAVNAAFQHLMMERRGDQKPAQLISLGMGRYYKQGDTLHMDVGPFAKALEFASGAKAEIVGKPDPAFFHAGVAALGQPGLVARQVAMVGDDIVSDVGGAMAAGLLGVQVRTGKFRSVTDEPHPTVTPSAYVDNLKQLVDKLLN